MQDTYKIIVKEKLRRYKEIKDTYKNSLDKIRELEEMKKNISVRWGDETVKGGGSSYEDKLLNINSEIEMLRDSYKGNIKLIRDIDSALYKLSSRDKDIVLQIYGTYERGNKIRELESKYHYEKSQLYRIANDSLRKISLNLYGNY